MIRIHPIVVHFPIALFISALGLEALSLVFKKIAFGDNSKRFSVVGKVLSTFSHHKKENLHKSAWVNYVLGVIAAFFAILSAWVENEQIKHPVFYAHRMLGYLTFAISFIGLIVSRKSRVIFLTFLIIVAVLIAVTGFYGGRLVYEYGVGVEQ